MSEHEKKKDALAKIPSHGLIKVDRSIKITNKIIDKSNKRQFESERTHFDTIKIGDQEWMGRNLDVAYFQNRDPIQEIQDAKEWVRAGQEGRPAWCYYDNDPENAKVYGKLYNWFAVNDLRGLAPDGWKIPNKKDFDDLAAHLGGWEFAGQKLKSIVEPPSIPPFKPPSQLEIKPNASQAVARLFEAQKRLKEIQVKKWEKRRDQILAFKKGTNESGFNALLGGFRFSSSDASFYEIESLTSFWSTVDFDDKNAWILSIGSTTDEARVIHNPKNFGFSVRCIKTTPK